MSCIKRALMLGIFKTPPVAQTRIRFNEGFVALEGKGDTVRQR